VSRIRSREPTFFELFSRGGLTADRIGEFVSQWHTSDASEKRSLAAFLGMTEDEYGVWLIDPKVLPQILIARRTGRPLEDVIAEYIVGSQDVSHPPDPAAQHALDHWLTARSTHYTSSPQG